MTIIIILAILVWFGLGLHVFVHYWSKVFNITVKDIPLWLFSATFGPFNYLAGWLTMKDEEYIDCYYDEPGMIIRCKRIPPKDKINLEPYGNSTMWSYKQK